MERTAGPQWRNHCRCLKRYEHWEFATTLQLFHSHIRFLTNRMLWFALLLRLACPQALTEHQGRVKLFSFRQCLRLFSLNLWVNSWVNQFLLLGLKAICHVDRTWIWLDGRWVMGVLSILHGSVGSGFVSCFGLPGKMPWKMPWKMSRKLSGRIQSLMRSLGRAMVVLKWRTWDCSTNDTHTYACIIK